MRGLPTPLAGPQSGVSCVTPNDASRGAEGSGSGSGRLAVAQSSSA